MRHFLLLLMFVVPSLGNAQQLPTLHNVMDVEADDVLNVRISADSGSEILGTFAPDAKNIEIVAISEDQKWGRVNVGERSGWVSLRYMQRQAANSDYVLAQSLACYGTEPFWSFDIAQGQGATYADPETSPVELASSPIFPSRSYINRYAVVFEDNNAAIFRAAKCSDGMSDRMFGIEIDLLIDGSGEKRLLSGCCSITAH